MVSLKYYQWIEHLNKAKEKKADSFFIGDEEFELSKIQELVNDGLDNIKRGHSIYTDYDKKNTEPMTIYNSGFGAIPLHKFRIGV